MPIKKKEFLNGNIQNDQTILIQYSGSNRVVLTYENEGSTGIKNNGMKVFLDGSDRMQVQLGKATGLGIIVNRAAKSIIGEGMSMTSQYALQDEYFTANRAGYGGFAYILSVHLPQLLHSKTGGLSFLNDQWHLRYSKHTTEKNKVVVNPEDSIFKLEELYGTVAFFIKQNNPDLFRNLYSLFHRNKSQTVEIPQWFLNFDLTLDNVSWLPKRLIIYEDNNFEHVLGDYTYELLDFKTK